jgi:hypothetical protein
VSDPNDPSWIFAAAEPLAGPAYFMAVVEVLAQRFDRVVQIDNALASERPRGGTLTSACWRRLHSLFPGGDELVVGWWSGRNMAADLTRCLGTEPFAFSLVETSDLEWDLWTATAAQAEVCGTETSHFTAPTLFFPSTREWVALGTPTDFATVIAASGALVEALEGDPELVVGSVSE